MDKIILTGDRPTGRLHLGHYVGSLKRRVELQNSGVFDKVSFGFPKRFRVTYVPMKQPCYVEAVLRSRTSQF